MYTLWCVRVNKNHALLRGIQLEHKAIIWAQVWKKLLQHHITAKIGITCCLYGNPLISLGLRKTRWKHKSKSHAGSGLQGCTVLHNLWFKNELSAAHAGDRSEDARQWSGETAEVWFGWNAARLGKTKFERDVHLSHACVFCCRGMWVVWSCSEAVPFPVRKDDSSFVQENIISWSFWVDFVIKCCGVAQLSLLPNVTLY